MNQILLCLLLAIVIVYLSTLFMNTYEGMSSKRRARKDARAVKKTAKAEAKSEKKEVKAEKKAQKKEVKAEKKAQKKEVKAEKKEGRKEHRAEKKEGRKEHRAEKKEARAERKEDRKEHRAEKKEARAERKEEHIGKIPHASSDEEEMLNEQISKDISDIAFSTSDKNNLADIVNEFKNKKIKNANKDTILKYIRSIRVLKLRINNDILFKTKFTDVFNYSEDTEDNDMVSVLTNVDSTIKKKTAVINQLNILEDSLIDHYNYLQKLVN